MEQMNNENGLVTVLDPEVAIYDDNALFAIAEQAEKRVTALNTIMNAALRITTGMDWTIIGGKPYLQESGATKVARLFGISWKILNLEQKIDEGYPAFSYTMEFSMGGARVEAIGARSGKDEFFTGQRTNREGNPNPNFKTPDQIDANDVKKSAFTNCLNRGIKSILPGLRNLDVATLTAAGITAGSGYTFKDGTKGGVGKSAASSGITCADCGAAITQKVASYSEGRFGKRLCMTCQKKPQKPPEDDYIPPEPPESF